MSFGLGYLYDEHMPDSFVKALRDLEPAIDCRRIGDSDAPSKGTLDPHVLEWIEVSGLLLVTNNRRSMPVHLADHLAAGRHIPGILVIKETMSPGELANELLLVAACSFPDEYRDRIVHLPIS